MTISPNCWLITGCAGFIGSNLLESLLRQNERVIGLDNFATGKPANLEQVRALVGDEAWGRFAFIEGDLRDAPTCRRACTGVTHVLHQGALGSVPRSIADPIASNESNVTGTLNMLVAAREQGVKRFVYASSSSVYGDHPALPKVEGVVGAPLSPYAVTKCVNELYASQFYRHYGLETVGLRYFNVFGPRQDPNGPYAAVIPKWIAAMIKGDEVVINGTGETSRDFCYIANVVQANLLAARTTRPEAVGKVYNVALNDRTTLNELYELLRSRLAAHFPHLQDVRPVYRDFRPGDVLHSQADITRAAELLGYRPSHTVSQGLDEALEWYMRQSKLREEQ